MIYCRECGKELPDTAKFCSDCGAQQQQNVPAAHQPQEMCHDYPPPQELINTLLNLSLTLAGITLHTAGTALETLFSEDSEQADCDIDEIEKLLEEMRPVIQACNYHLQCAGQETLPCDILSVRVADIMAESQSDPDEEDDFFDDEDFMNAINNIEQNEKLMDFLEELSSLCTRASEALEQLE